MQLNCVNKNQMTKPNNKADTFGCLTSILCLIHCSISPILMMTWTATSLQTQGLNTWWSFLDYAFIIFSFFAISTATKNNKTKIKTAFWFSWVLLLGILLNEKLKLLSLPESLIYFPTVSIILLHIYNLTFPAQTQKSHYFINHSAR